MKEMAGHGQDWVSEGSFRTVSFYVRLLLLEKQINHTLDSRKIIYLPFHSPDVAQLVLCLRSPKSKIQVLAKLNP